jgi:hypothetical protein
VASMRGTSTVHVGRVVDGRRNQVREESLLPHQYLFKTGEFNVGQVLFVAFHETRISVLGKW